MKYWYDSLEVKHPIKLNRWDTKISYYLWLFLVDYLLRIRPIYVAFTWFFFFMLHRLFALKDYVHKYLDHRHGSVVYRLRRDYHLNNPYNNYCNFNNHNKKKEKNKDENNNIEYYYQIDNYMYKPNV